MSTTPWVNFGQPSFFSPIRQNNLRLGTKAFCQLPHNFLIALHWVGKADEAIPLEKGGVKVRWAVVVANPSAALCNR
jgi:hypothetical protein